MQEEQCKGQKRLGPMSGLRELVTPLIKLKNRVLLRNIEGQVQSQCMDECKRLIGEEEYRESHACKGY